MATVGDIANRVTRKILKRNSVDLYDEAVDACVDAYLMICQKVPFEELMQTADAFTTTSGTRIYDLDSQVEEDFAGIVSIRFDHDSTGYQLKQIAATDYDKQATHPSGRPRTFARWAPPSRSIQLRTRRNMS